MSLYNKDLIKMDINIDELERINDIVTNAFIYRYKSIILKKYWIYTEYAIKDDVFNKLCNIDNKHFIKLYDLFTIINDEEYDNVYNNFINGKYSFSKSGYTAQYYEPYDINPLLVKSSYLINSVDGLIEMIELLSSMHIIMSDVKVRNIIYQKDGIVLIDPDYYDISDKDINSIKNNNYKELLMLLKSIYTSLYFDKVHIINKLFNELESENLYESVCEFKKKLKKVDKPIKLIEY